MKKFYNTPEIELMKLTSLTATCDIVNDSSPFFEGGGENEDDTIED